jgi:hypothetical protein
MCHFITLVASSSDEPWLDSWMKGHGRRARTISNPSLQKILKPDERQFLTSAGNCDCGTVLGMRQASADAAAAQHAKTAAKFRKRGWSRAKIERWFHDRQAADARPSPQTPDSIELWTGVVSGLPAEGLQRVGLFVRLYSGDLETETFDAARTEASLDELAARLQGLREGELLIVSQR